jgi:hypothetical protein
MAEPAARPLDLAVILPQVWEAGRRQFESDFLGQGAAGALHDIAFDAAP